MKTRIKIALLIAVTACFLGVIIGFSTMFVSSENNPVIAYEQFCGYISDGDFRAVIEMTGNTVDTVSGSDNEAVDELVMSKLLQKIKIEALSEPKTNAIIAKQPVRISYVDMGMLMKKLFSGVLAETSEYEWNHGSYENDDQIAEAIKNSLTNQLNGEFDDCIVTDTITIEYHYKDGKWFPLMSKELYRALTGNADKCIDSIEELIKEYENKKSSDSEKS